MEKHLHMVRFDTSHFQIRGAALGREKLIYGATEGEKEINTPYFF